ncbi:MAG TPA: BlaI/MecI/CopY family transcriptional regulator [Thermoanaerobaculia bacterium]
MKRPPISDAEWEVMNALWEASPRTAAEVAEAVFQRTKWNPKTVRTLLARLVKKGAVRYKVEGKRYLYRPTVSHETYIRQETQSFVDRVFGGEATPAVVHFVRTLNLTEQELDELRSILGSPEEE